MLGYDMGGRCCYYQHIYTITRDVLDDENNLHEAASCHEILTTWLLDNGQCLCCKNNKVCMDCNQTTQFRYELAQNRPG